VQPLLGYAERLSLAPGETLRVCANVNSAVSSGINTSLVRIVCADTRASGAGFREETVAWKAEDLRWNQAPAQERDVRCVAGSYGRTSELPRVLRRWTFSCYFMPTLRLPDDDQTLFVMGDVRITIRDRRLHVSDVAMPLETGRWHWLSMACDGASLTVFVKSLPKGVAETPVDRSETIALQRPPELRGAGTFGGFFYGRIELPWIANGALAAQAAEELSRHPEAMFADPRVEAAWDFSLDISSDRMIDVCANGLHGNFFNHPTRAVRGVRWDGSVQDWTRDPSHYGAVHFHADDLTDAQWAWFVEWKIPADFPGGIYAVKLESDDDLGYITFFVRPSPDQPRAKAVFLVPTASYLAYANNRFPMYAAIVTGMPMARKDEYLRDHKELGWSLYERHADGSGVHYSSYHRPILDLGPCEDAWGFTADTNIAAWLHHIHVPFDVITDEDLHREGGEILAPYNVVITGTHPEYASTRMLDGLEAYLAGGGRLMYMGGNGFYWRVAYDPENSAIIELRRAEGRGRAWDSEPGEYYHSFTGEYGGLWRLLGRPPNRVAGVGFVALAQDDATAYRRLPPAGDPRARFIFEGATEGDVFGAYGSMHGGAVSQEIDRWNPLLDSPRHALVIATSVPPAGDFMLCREEADALYPGVEGPKLRADMVFYETPAGGAVFSTGSIGFAGALAHNGYGNDVCRIATNVLHRFADPTPFLRQD
jgi:N,N-dimethylformamidase